MSSLLLDIVAAHKAGQGGGICSVCSAHPLVIEAALRESLARGVPALIEATSNQVNQFGGYTGMTPADFHRFVAGIAEGCGFPLSQLILGGDHLGPNVWRAESPASAMDKACTMVAQYVAAGFRKIHLDCSMSCAGDPTPVPEGEIARRAAQLCAAAEAAWQHAGGEAPVYVIGTEVPVPGGAHEELAELAVTSPEAAAHTIATHERAFAAAGLQNAWQRVVALVVQPGVEFDHHQVIDYIAPKARALSAFIESQPALVYEAHSTDYQTPANLAALVRDHFAILKVGPGVTFALREAFWALADMERDWLGTATASGFKEAVLGVMRDEPKNWQAYYPAGERQHLDLQYSLSDRIRYYWPHPTVQQAFERMCSNLRAAPAPLPLVSQYLPAAYTAIREGRIANEPEAMAREAVGVVLRQYLAACAPKGRA